MRVYLWHLVLVVGLVGSWGCGTDKGVTVVQGVVADASADASADAAAGSADSLPGSGSDGASSPDGQPTDTGEPITACTTDADCAGLATTKCAVGKCSASTHECVLVDAASGLACDDGDVCTVGTVCQQGVCAGGSAIVCPDDDNPCTSTVCDPADGCAFVASSADCDDGDPCTLNDACKDGVCSGGPASCDCAPCDALHVCVNGLCEEKCGPLSPVAIIGVDEGAQVGPAVLLHLHGDQSQAPGGSVVKWEWTLVKPPASSATLNPGTSDPNPTLQADAPGTFKVTLSVWDDQGRASCEAATAEIVVAPAVGPSAPGPGIHVELTWNTPDDPDQYDQGPQSGADVDLHFVHPLATGPDLDGDGEPDPWLDKTYDCFWYNPTPLWDGGGPTLIQDDSDGAGPEVLIYPSPMAGRTYRIGAHYWNDHKFGPSYLTLRIWIDAVLTLELVDIKLLKHDMWTAATIEWPSGKVTQLKTPAGGLKITPNYESPFFIDP